MIAKTPERVLSTLDKDGQRHWIKPRLSTGRFLTARRVVAYALMAVFFVLPWVKINQKPAVLLDIVARRFTILGYTFLPTDTILLALFMVFIFVSIFLFTAIFGRLWCGWACPQTVYMEFLYRPLERLLEGTTGRGGPAKRHEGWRAPAYFLLSLAITAIPAHTFLAYFVGVEQLSRWVRASPFDHPTAFLVMAVTVVLMMFDFYWFREQLCLIACPYGRFQSVLLDKFSLIVSYDHRRGEPRGRHSDRSISPPLAAQEVPTGDCVDCSLCVTTCPTGIDIRQGLQMECINCTQCMDACDSVMDKLKRPRGLIRFSSQLALEGDRRRHFRMRLVFYPALLVVIAAVWITLFAGKAAADITLLRNFGNPFSTLASGDIANSVRVKITNRTDTAAAYSIAIVNPPEARLDLSENPVSVPANQSRTEGFVIELPLQSFVDGICEVTLRLNGSAAFQRDAKIRLLGPSREKPVRSEDYHENK